MRQSHRFFLALCAVAFALTGCGKTGSNSAALQSSADFTSPEAVRASEAFGVYEDGWVGSEAEVLFGNKAHHSVLTIEGTNVQTKPGDEALSLAVLVGSDTVDVLKISSLGEFSERIVLSQKVSALDSLDLRLLPSKNFVPSKLGTSMDDRSLSFRLKRLALGPLEKAQGSFPEFFGFPASAAGDPNVQGIFSDGWMSDSASVTLYNPGGKQMVEIRGLVPGNIYTGVATLDVFMDGALVVRNQVKGEFRLRFQVPEKPRGANKVALTLKPGSVFVPAEKGISDDKRRLSYQLSFVGVR